MDTPFPLHATGLEVLRYEAWKPIDWLIHGFSTRIGGSSAVYSPPAAKCGELNLGFTAEDERAHVMENREALIRKLVEEPGTAAAPVKLVTLRQIHSKQVHRVGGNTSDGAETGDGLMTNEPGLLLAIQTADCVPVLIVDRERKAVAAFHAGWRGTVRRIVEDGVGSMRAEFGSAPEDLSAVIGPCISSCCYAVGSDVRSEFATQFSYADALFGEVSRDGGAPALHLDLVEANRRQLLAAGLGAETIHALHRCTSCEPDWFFSYRKSGGRTGRLMSVIGVRPEN